MATPAAAQETLVALRQEIARIEGVPLEKLSQGRGDGSIGVTHFRSKASSAVLPVGVDELDRILGGGVPLAALTEIHTQETRDAGAANGLTLALLSRLVASGDQPLLWVTTSDIVGETGLPYALGLAGTFGIAADRLVLAEARKLSDALWITEEAAGQKSFAAVILEVRGNGRRLDLTVTQRLHLRARKAAERPIFLIRQAAAPDPTAAPVRLSVKPAPSALRQTSSAVLPRSIGPPRFVVSVSKSRLVLPIRFLLEWNADECALLDCGQASFTQDTEACPAHPGRVLSLSSGGANSTAPLRPYLETRAIRA